LDFYADHKLSFYVVLFNIFLYGFIHSVDYSLLVC